MNVINGDCIEQMKLMAENSVDSIVTDPPYELNFMNKGWDNTGIAFNKEVWKEALRILKPGGHLLAFGGTRTYHRMVVAIEDAGFEIRDMIEWMYGSGFPKSNNISKSIDKMKGAKRKVIGMHPNICRNGGGGYLTDGFSEAILTQPSTPEAIQWDGWGTNLKPSHEPICLARKPITEKTIAQNVLKYGTGGINIDECRVSFDKEKENFGKAVDNYGNKKDDFNKPQKRIVPPKLGRFPANLIHDGSDEVLQCLPDSKSSVFNNTKKENGTFFGMASKQHKFVRGFNDDGSAARFFYCAKVNKSERNMGCEDLLDKHYLKGGGNYGCKRGGVDKLIKQGKTIEEANRIIQQNATSKNNHPTVKPITLLKYLITLITPPKGIVLDMFMGSGSTGIAAKQLGFDFIGIELNPDYVEIANKRINSAKLTKITKNKKPKETKEPKEPKQLLEWLI